MTFLQGLQLLFIGLKLCGKIDWNWGLIMIPIFVDYVLYELRKERRNRKIADIYHAIKDEIDKINDDDEN